MSSPADPEPDLAAKRRLVRSALKQLAGLGNDTTDPTPEMVDEAWQVVTMAHPHLAGESIRDDPERLSQAYVAISQMVSEQQSLRRRTA